MSVFDTQGIWDEEEYGAGGEPPELPNHFSSNDSYDDSEDELDEFIDSISSDEQNELSTMDKVRLRLEQGRLYEMLIKHDLFEDVDAMPEAVQKVQLEIKQFITERLEVLLGIRAEKETIVQQITSEPQFNDLEVQTLKMVVQKMTNGASLNAPTTKKEPSPINVVKKEAPKEGLKKLSVKNNVTPKPTPTPTPTAGRPLRNRVNKQVKRPTSTPQLKAEFLNKGVENVEEAAKKDIKYIESLEKMSLEEANKIVSQRHSRPKPPPSNVNQDIINSHYKHKVSMNEEGNTFAQLLKLAKKV